MRALILDTETANLKKGVCDIALIQIDSNFNALWSTESLIDPECPISPSASGVHHIVDSMVQESPTLAQFMEMHGDPLDCDDLVIIGHKAQFDIGMVVDHLPKAFLKVCTLKLSREAFPDAENHKLQTLRYTFGLDAGDAHRAMGDCVTTLSLLRLLGEHYSTDLLGLIDLARKPMSMDTPLPFGKKHNGVPLKDVPLSYVQWMLKEVKDLDPDLREALASRVS